MTDASRSSAARRDRIVVGASAGGLQALQRLVRSLPADLPAAVLVVLHTTPSSKNYLPGLLSEAGQLPAKQAVDGEPILPGQIYVAPPDFHMLVASDLIKLTRGPRENRQRPSVDALFRSAALTCGRRVIGVVLSGELDDGTQGLYYIKECGGVAIVQDPASASHGSMPRNAMAAVEVDHCLTLDAIGPALRTLTLEKSQEASHMMVHPVFEPVKTPAPFTCPDCNGPLWESKLGALSRFECGVGHAFSADGLLAGRSEEAERALWTAVKELEQSAALMRYLAKPAPAIDTGSAEPDFDRQARRKEEHAAIIRRILETHDPMIR